MKVGLIGISGKPIHKGHWNLITKASSENDLVRLFVSTTDRDDGAIVINGNDMRDVWDKYLIIHLPSNVKVEFGGSPVRKIYDYLGQANENQSIDTFQIYSDPIDMKERFHETKLVKYFRDLMSHDQIKLICIDRTGEYNVTGQKMRDLLRCGMKDAFVSLLPECVDGQSIWQLLLLKSFIRNEKGQ